jgi:hypothetical protein
MTGVIMRRKKPDFVPGFFYAPRAQITIFLDAFSIRGANYMVKAEPSMVRKSD